MLPLLYEWGEKASLAGEPPSMYKKQIERYSICSHLCSSFNSSTFEIHNLTGAISWQFPIHTKSTDYIIIIENRNTLVFRRK